MSLELKLPPLGEQIEEGTVVRILVSPGEVIAREQSIIEVETGKANVEVPSSAAGKVKALLVSLGQKVAVGQTIMTIEEDVSARPSATPAPGKAAQAPAPAPKAPATVVATAAAPAPAPQAAPAPVVAATGEAVAAPHVRQFAREVGVDIGEVQGSGPGGRISVDDVKAHARGAAPAEPAARPQPAAEPPLPDFSRFGPVERLPLTTVRVLTAEAMRRAWTTIPHVVLQAEADVTEMEAFRHKHKGQIEAAGGKLTVTAIVVEAVAKALKAHPSVNASIDAAAKELVLKKYVHVGVAADTPRGLLVPVVRDAGEKTLEDLAIEIQRLAEKARAGKLAPGELQGASFTVTNLGGYGIGHFTAVINPPEVAILAVGKAATRVAWEASALRPRAYLPLALSIDHRVLDGADGARFLGTVVKELEQRFQRSL